MGKGITCFFIFPVGEDDVRDRQGHPLTPDNAKALLAKGGAITDWRIPNLDAILKEVEKHLKYQISPHLTLADINRVILLSVDVPAAEAQTNDSAQVIKQLLQRDHGIRESKIQILTIKKLAFMHIFSQLRKLDNLLAQGELIFLGITRSNSPAGFALLFRLLLKYKHKVHVVRILPDATANADYILVNQMLQVFKFANVQTLMTAYQYSACMELFEEGDVYFHVFRFLKAWKNMDYELAEFLLRNHVSAELRRMLVPCYKAPGNIEDALRELFFNMTIQLHIGEYVDALGRLYSFRENLVMYALHKLAGYPLLMDAEGHEHLKLHQRFVAENPELEGYLSSRKEQDHKLRYGEPNFKVFRWMLRFYESRHKDAAAFIPALNKLDRVLEYRNKTIIGHGFGGCSEVMFAEKLGMSVPEFIEVVKQTLNVLGIAVGSNPFDKINTLLAKRLAV